MSERIEIIAFVLDKIDATSITIIIMMSSEILNHFWDDVWLCQLKIYKLLP